MLKEFGNQEIPEEINKFEIKEKNKIRKIKIRWC